jgi:hypothetical protein
MITFLIIYIVVLLALAIVGWLADQRAAANRPDVAWTFFSARRHQVRESERKRQRLFPHCDVDSALNRAHTDPSTLRLSAAHFFAIASD